MLNEINLVIWGTGDGLKEKYHLMKLLKLFNELERG